MKINKNLTLNTLGSILIISSLIRIIIISIYDTPIHLLWLSNHLPLFLGISILFRNSFWVLAELSLIFIGEMMWSIDYISKLFFNEYLVGSTEYMFIGGINKLLYASSLTHLIVVPIGLLAFFMMKKKVNYAWTGAMLHTAILTPFILYFGEKYNINCFIESCISWIPTIKLFPLIYLLICVIPLTYLLNWFVESKKK